MDRKRFAVSSQPVAKRMRYDQPNTSNIDSNPSKTTTTYSLETCLQKVQHLLRKPVKLVHGDNAKSAQSIGEDLNRSNTKTTYALATCLQKVQHLIRKPVKLEPDGNAESAQSNKEDVNRCNTTHSTQSALQKNKHLLHNPIQIERVKKENATQQNAKFPLQYSMYNRTFCIEETLRKVQNLFTSNPQEFENDDESKLAVETDDSVPTQSLMILNDDCLLTLFDYLKPADLINMAYVNVRLNKLVKWYVQTKKKIKCVPNNKWIEGDRINVEVLQEFFGIFGEDIHSLTLNRKSFDDTFNDFGSMDRILRFIQQYCHLTEMQLIGFGMCGLTPHFCSQLKSLTLDDCSVTRDWTDMKQLKTLKLNKVIFRRYPFKYVYDREFYEPRKPIPIPFNHFGALEKVQLTDVNVTNDDVVKLIKSNQKLKSLSVLKCFEVSPSICNVTGKLKHLEEFEFQKKKKFGSNIFQPLVSLKKLKVLKLTHPDIWAPEKLFEGFIANGTTLKHLELGLTPWNSSVAVSISKMQSIKILKLNEMTGLNESHVTGIANQLKSLEELHVKTNSTISQDGIKEIVRAANRLTCLKVDAPDFVLDIATYQSMLVTVQARETQSKLKLTIYGDGNQLAVPNDLLNGPNEKWLTVEQFNRNEHHLFEDLTSKVGPAPPLRTYYSDSDDDYSDYYD